MWCVVVVSIAMFDDRPGEVWSSPSQDPAICLDPVGALERSSGFLSSHDPMYSSVVPDTKGPSENCFGKH